MSAASLKNEKRLRRIAIGDTSHYRVVFTLKERCFWACRHCGARVQAHHLDQHTKKRHAEAESLLMAEVPC